MSNSNQLSTFSAYASMFEVARTNNCREAKIYAIGQALTLTEIDSIITLHKEGWHGIDGKFARAISRMLSQLE